MRWGTRQPLPLPIAFVRFVAVLAVLLAAVFALPAAAHADEPAEGDNAVNTQQLPDSSFIYDTSIVDLSGAGAYYDNQTVQVTGEVIGDSIFCVCAPVYSATSRMKSSFEPKNM